jgi:CBS domain containing-hemolysin-like protein
VIPLAIFLLGCAAVYLGAIDAAFSALMRLSLRLTAERSNRPGALGAYLDDPLLLFIPVRFLLGVVTGVATALLGRLFGGTDVHIVAIAIATIIGFVLVFELLLPLLIVGRDPERVLEWVLPTFVPVARALAPITGWLARAVATSRRQSATQVPPDEAAEEANEVAKAFISNAEEEGIIEGEERRLLQSIVDFGDTLVREVMTPRPDIVAVREDASIGDLRAVFAEQEYSRFPVYKENLDNIAGFVFIKDVFALGASTKDEAPIRPLIRHAVVVPETKRVPELLKQFQRQQTQCAIVVDEYGGTAGLVTIEDLLEEIVGEIRDEYDVETEPIVDEGRGRFLFSGKVHVDEVAQRLNVEIERDGFETVGGYLMSHIGRVPGVGEKFEVDGLTVEIVDAERRRINRVRITKRPVAHPVDADDASAKARIL